MDDERITKYIFPKLDFARGLKSLINEARITLRSIEEAQNFDEKAHSEARANLEEGLRREEIFWRQKSRVAWLKDGDRSTKFFMASTGTTIEEMKDIAQLFIEKFTSTFSKNGSRLKTNPIGIGRFYGILLSMGGALCIFKVIWEARNEVVHGTRLRPIMEVINSVNRLYNDHLSRWKSNANKRVNKRITEVGWWNCCTDVSIQPNQSFGAAVFRDHMDRIVAIYSERFSTTNPTLAEATILASAAEFARVNLKGKVVFYCDNKVVVANCSNICNTNQNIDIKGVADRFKSTVRLLDDFKLRKIDRNCNFMAHNSAKWAASVSALGVLDLGTMDANIFSNVREWSPD
ncbi:hypothetical protein F8388_011832 [Cannabis sativa]|uniref:RNase H type-1 domain-containing protein n=1 Tax=Cannabis sativa TaxID=3483 RepID=A0A7J6F2Z7_CANSA|nr:hypothetical protein F8388_011832 [Cannabis sativa]